MNKKLFFILILGLSFTGNVYAVSCSSCVNTTINEAAKTNSRIDKMSSNITQAVDRARVEIIKAIDNATRSQTDALNSQATEQTKAQAKNQLELERALGKRNERVSRSKVTCSSASSSQGGGSSGAGVKRPGNGSTNVNERYRKFMDEGEEKRLPTSSQSERLADISVGICNTWSASDTSVLGQACKWINDGGIPESKSKYIEAPTKPETIFDGPQKDKDAINPMRSVPLDGDARAARKAALSLVKDPLSPTPPTEEQMKGPAGIVYAGAYTAYKAIADIASYPLEAHDRRTSDKIENQEALKMLLADENSGEFVQKELSKMDRESGFWEKDGISDDMLQYLEVERRIGNSQWYKQMAAGDDKVKQTEQLMISAYSLRMQREQLEATRRQNIMLGLLLQTSNNNAYREMLETGKSLLISGQNSEQEQ